MSQRNLRIRRNYTPARMIIVDEFQDKGSLTVKHLRKRVNLLSVPPVSVSQSQETKCQSVIHFPIKHRPEVYLFDPPLLQQKLIKQSRRLKILNDNKKLLNSPNKLYRRQTKLFEQGRVLLAKETLEKNSGREIKFFKFIKNNNDEDLEQLISDYPKLVFSYDSLKMTGLHWAAKRNLIEIAKLLLRYNANPNTRDILNRTCLDIARKQGHHALAQVFSEFCYRSPNPFKFN